MMGRKLYLSFVLACLFAGTAFAQSGEIRGKMLRGAPVCSEFFEVSRESESVLSQVLASAVATGEIRGIDPELAAITIVDLTRGLMERRLLGRCRNQPACDTEFLLDLIWHALARTGESHMCASS